MNEDFELPVDHNGRELFLPARFLRTGYSYRVEVEIYGQTVMFEPDEEREWRALADPGIVNAGKIKKRIAGGRGRIAQPSV